MIFSLFDGEIWYMVDAGKRYVNEYGELVSRPIQCFALEYPEYNNAIAEMLGQKNDRNY